MAPWRHGAQFVLVSAPMSERKRNLLGDLAEEEGVPYLPLDPYLAGLDKERTFLADGHWSARGHEAAAAALEVFLESHINDF